MHGRNCPRLLATSLFILMVLSFLFGQSDSRQLDSAKDRANPAPDFVFAPNPIRPPLKPTLPVQQVTSTTGLGQLTHSAGTIFSGTVRLITRSPLRTGSVDTVTITFHVENAIRGATPGSDFTISQWMGLWSAGQRYRVGERVLLFLYPPSKLGLTSCVAAPIGRFRIDPSGRISLTAQQLAAFRTDSFLGRKSRVSFSDFALAVQQAGQEN